MSPRLVILSRFTGVPSISVHFERAWPWPWPCRVRARTCGGFICDPLPCEAYRAMRMRVVHRAECHWPSTYRQRCGTGRLNTFLLVVKLHALGPCLYQEPLQCVVVLRRARKTVHLPSHFCHQRCPDLSEISDETSL